MAITEQMGEATSSDEETQPMLITKTNVMITDTNAMTLFEDFQQNGLQKVKLQADRIKGSIKAKKFSEKRGTLEGKLTIKNKLRHRGLCSKIFGRSVFKDRFYSFFISYFDASIILLPFIFKRAGWLTCSFLMGFFATWSLFSSLLIFECVRLLLGNYKMRQQGVDFESMVANFKHIATHGSFTAGGTFKPWLTRTLASPTSVIIIRHFYIVYLILASSIGLVLSQYTMDSVFQLINGGTNYALQLMPEAKILAETDTIQPFVNNYFSLSIGFCIVFGLALI